MTRDFNKQPRGGSHPLSRNIPSSRYQEDQSSRPAGSRLNRAMVDRGWKNGTPRQHADYHPRTDNGQAPRNNWRKNQEAGHSSYNGTPGSRTNGTPRQHTDYHPRTDNGQAPRNNWRKNQEAGHSSYNGTPGSRTNRNSQSNYNNQTQRFEPKGDPSTRKHSSGSKGYDTEKRRLDNHYDYSDKPHSPNNYRTQNNQKRPQGRSPNFGTQERFQGRPNDYRNDHRPQHNREQDKRYTGLNERPMYDDQGQQRTQHPRAQSRPEAFQKQQEDRRIQKTVPSSETTAENKDRENHPLVFPNKQTKPSPMSKQTKRATSATRREKSTDAQPPSTGPRPSQRGFKWSKP